MSSTALRHLGFNILLDASGEGAKWQKVFPLGETRHREDFGTITFTKGMLEGFVRNYVAEGKPKRPWNYFHRGASDDSQVRNEDKVAAGWFSDVQLRDDGLYVLTEWTAKAKAAIDAKELQYPSPEFTESATDPKTGKSCGPKLFAVALLNDPFLTDLPAVQASANPPAPKGPPMKLALANLVAAAKLNTDVTEDGIEAALKAKADELDAAKAELVQLKASATRTDAGVGDALKKLSEQITAQAAEIKKLNDSKATDAVAALQVKLEGEGRIIATEKETVATLVDKLGLDAAAKFCATWPVKVDLTERGTNRPGPEGGMTPEEAHKQLELKAAELVKSGSEQSMAYREAVRLNPELGAKATQLSAVREVARQMKA